MAAKPKKEKKPYSGIIHTKDEAKRYLNESIKAWDAANVDSVISLARFAEVWREGGEPEKKKMALLYTNINQNRNKITRYMKLGRPTGDIEAEIDADQAELAALESKFGKYVPVKPKKKEKDIIE